MNILIAEDDTVSLRFLQKEIEHLGHTAFPADNGLAAWKIYLKEDINLIIADWIMPDLDGLALCRNIRSSSKAGYAYFILLTAKNRKEDIINGLEAGADDYVTKPLDKEEIRVRIRAAERILDFQRELTEKNTELLKLNAKLQEMACIDVLTGIGNRRSFYAAIEKMHHRACRYGQPYSLILSDIDNFKNYNDTYGHLAGDEILRVVAQTLQNSLRTSDEVFRFGGEELILTLPDQAAEKTLLVAERVRKKIESLRIEHRENPSGIITISSGIAVFNQDCNSTLRWEALIDRADKALYRAKSEGKNRVCIS